MPVQHGGADGGGGQDVRSVWSKFAVRRHLTCASIVELKLCNIEYNVGLGELPSNSQLILDIIRLSFYSDLVQTLV